VKREGADYFVTFRLADSLPKEILLQYERERAERMSRLLAAKRAGRKPIDNEVLIHRDFRRKVERYLDKGAGACHLGRAEIAELVAGALRFFHKERYLLREWVVMPNHVHVLFWPLPNYLVGEITKSWKQFTSKRAKLMLELKDARFWQRESFDHWVRDEKERARITRYIRNNPVITRLCIEPADWKWSSAFHENAAATT